MAAVKNVSGYEERSSGNEADEELFGVMWLPDRKKAVKRCPPIMVETRVQGQKTWMEMDTGASTSVRKSCDVFRGDRDSSARSGG